MVMGLPIGLQPISSDDGALFDILLDDGNEGNDFAARVMTMDDTDLRVDTSLCETKWQIKKVTEEPEHDIALAP
jgi:hypothetical protein